MTIRDRLNRLDAEKRQQLQYAFDNEFSQYVEVGDGFFLGVFVDTIQHLEILEQAGSWSYGKIKEK